MMTSTAGHLGRTRNENTAKASDVPWGLCSSFRPALDADMGWVDETAEKWGRTQTEKTQKNVNLIFVNVHF